eukprot:gene2407-2871_t
MKKLERKDTFPAYKTKKSFRENFLLTNILCSIRTKTLATIFTFFVIFFGIITGIIIGVFSDTYFQYEVNGINQAARRINRVIKDLSDINSNFLGSYSAIWTETFDTLNNFLANSDPAPLISYFDANWHLNAFKSFEKEFIIYYWLHNKTIAKSRIYNPQANNLDTIPIPDELQTLPNFNGIDFSDTSTRGTGFLSPKNSNVTYILSVTPVQTDEFNGPVSAVALLGTRISSKVILDMSNRAQLCTTMYSYNDNSNWAPISTSISSKVGISPNITVNAWQDKNIAHYEVMKESITSTLLKGRKCWEINVVNDNSTFDDVRLTEERLSGYNVYNDIFGNKAVIFRIDLSRGINVLAQYSMITVLSILAGVGIGFFILIGLLLELFVLCRVTSLTTQIRRIKDSVDLNKRVKVIEGLDEVDYLTESINEMLSNVESTQSELQSTFNKLGNEEEKTRLMLNSIPDSILIAHPNTGKIIEVNEAFEKLFTKDWNEKIVFKILPDLGKKEFEQPVGRYTETVAIGSFDLKIPVQVVTCGIEFYHQDEKVLYVMCIIRDIREKNEFLDKLQKEMESYSTMENKFTFEEQFRDPIIRDALKKFCEKEKTAENIKLLIAVESYKKLDQSSRIKQQKYIMEKYLKEGSKYALNISNEAREVAIKKVKDGLGQIDLFTDLEKAVKFNLINESFARFQQEKEKYIELVLKDREIDGKKPRKRSLGNDVSSDDLSSSFAGSSRKHGTKTPTEVRSPTGIISPTGMRSPTLTRTHSETSLDDLGDLEERVL